MLNLANDFGPGVSSAISLGSFKGTARVQKIVNFALLMVIPPSNIEELVYQTDLGLLDMLLIGIILTRRGLSVENTTLR